jgi:hypothetical protein
LAKSPWPRGGFRQEYATADRTNLFEGGLQLNVTVAQHPWSADALFSKSVLYVGEMERFTAGDWRFGLWSSLSLELLARAAVANISPTLLANRKDWHNVSYALGNPSTKKDFNPSSAVAAEVFSMLSELLPEFSKELQDFCARHCANRNAELHSGEERFSGIGASEWLPKFYATCSVLLKSMNKTLDELFEDSKMAHEMILALQDTAAKAVGHDIESHVKLWGQKSPDDQKVALAQATAWATRHAGHRSSCPACASPAITRGTGRGAVSTEIDDDGDIIQRQTMLPSSFECIACGLKVVGLSKLSACGLGETFTSTSIFSAAEFFDLYTDEDLQEARRSVEEPQFEEDNNE